MDPFIQQLADLCRQFPTRAKWVFVPSHAIGRTIGERIALEGTNWANLRFVTPLDIAVRMAGPYLVEQGLDPSEDGLGPALIMRLLIGLSDEHTYFKPLAEQPSMAQALWSTIRELRMAGIHASDIDKKADAFESPQKHAELVALVSAYEQYLTDKKIADIPAVYEFAPSKDTYCPITPGDLWTEHPDAIWSPLQRALLDKLPGERITPGRIVCAGLPEPRRWPMLKRDVAAIAPTTNSDAERLAFVMRPDEAPQPHNDDTIRMFRAGGREAEIDEVFRRILASGAPLDQVEIACASSEYAPLVWEKACRLDWPVTIATGIPASVTRPGRALLAGCDWIEGDFVAADMRHLLQSGDVTLGKDAALSGGQAARLLAKSEPTWGRETYRLALTRLERKYRGKSRDSERSVDLQNAAREKADGCAALRAWIQNLIDVVPAATSNALNGKLNLRNLIRAAEGVLEKSCACTSALDALARQQLQESVGELHALDALECSMAQALGFVRERVMSASVGADRARPGHLYISSLSLCGYAGRQHLFVVGLEEGKVFPSRAEDPVLLDAERRAISDRLRCADDRVDELQFEIVTRIASAASSQTVKTSDAPLRSGSMCFSYSCRDTRQYRESLPSWMMLQVARLASGRPAMNYEQLDAYLGQPVSSVPEPRDDAVTASGWWLSSVKRTGQAGVDAVGAQFPSLAHGRDADKRRDDADFTQYDGFVPAAGKALDPSANGSTISATTLEDAAKCPFRYFLQRGLGVDPVGDVRPDRDLWLDPLTRGSELHALFAQLMRRCRDERRRPDPKKDKWLLEAARKRLDALGDEMPPPSAPVFDRERADFLRDVELFIEYESKWKDGTPIGFEVAFGRRHSSEEEDPLAQDQPVTIAIDSRRKIRLNGRIDRIDRITPSVYDVIDYKTGGYWKADWKGIFAGGTRLQHALYALAALELLKKEDPAATIRRGVYLFPSAKAARQRVEIPSPDRKATGRVIGDLLDAMAGGAFIHTCTEDSCTFCDFGNACGDNAPGRANAKVANPAEKRLQAVRRLAGHE